MFILTKRILNASILSLAIVLGGFILNKLIPVFPDKDAIVILVVSFYILSLLVLGLNFLGAKKEPEAQSLFTLGAVGLKFLFSAVIALLYFAVFKKTGLLNILLFFVLYLTFTVSLISVLIKDLNNRTIKRD